MYGIEIKELIKLVQKRNDNNLSSDFVEIYEDFLLNDLDNPRVMGRYFELIRNIIEGKYKARGPGNYRGAKNTDESILNRCAKDAQLFFDIKSNGVKRPIWVAKDEYGIECGGYHRLVISNVLNHKHIKCNGSLQGLLREIKNDDFATHELLKKITIIS